MTNNDVNEKTIQSGLLNIFDRPAQNENDSGSDQSSDVYDWGFMPYTALYEPATKLIYGSLVTIFNTVTNGDIAWQGTIDIDPTDCTQRDTSLIDWHEMFHHSLPARLTKNDGTVIFGALCPYYNSEEQRHCMAIMQYGEDVNFIELQQGEQLTVYKNVRAGEIEWQGTVEFDMQHTENVPFLNGERVPHATHMDMNRWIKLCWQSRPAIIEPA